MKDLNSPLLIAEVITQTQVHTNTVLVAEQYGYQGELTIGALEDRIRFYQRRTVDDILELGKCLLVMKEMCPHGEFNQRVELLGFNKRTAQKFMQATLKFKGEFNSLLSKVDSQTKLLELVTLDDDDLEALNNGESIANINLDDIERMSTTELKKALKEARAESTAKEELLLGKDRKINELDSKLSVRKQPDQFKQMQIEMEQHIHDELAQATASLMTAVSQFNAKIDTLREQADENHLPHLNNKIQQDISLAYDRIAQIGLEVGVDLKEMMNPAWLTGDDTSKAEDPTEKAARERREFQAFRKASDPEFQTDEDLANNQ